MSSTAQFRRSSKSSVSGSPQPDGCLSLGFRRLAARVITQALRDLKSASADERKSAQTFLNGSAMLGFWCDLAEIRTAHVVARAATGGADGQSDTAAVATRPVSTIRPSR